MNNLSQKHCVPCTEGTKPLDANAADSLFKKLKTGWRAIEAHHLEKEFAFKDFRQALSFTNKVGELAEREGHHPDIYLAWGKVRVAIWTHKVNGLTESDFILASKVDEIG